jgi:hypothetical protein
LKGIGYIYMCIRESVLSHNANHTVHQPGRELRRGPHRILSVIEGLGLK